MIECIQIVSKSLLLEITRQGTRAMSHGNSFCKKIRQTLYICFWINICVTKLFCLYNPLLIILKFYILFIG